MVLPNRDCGSAGRLADGSAVLEGASGENQKPASGCTSRYGVRWDSSDLA